MYVMSEGHVRRRTLLGRLPPAVLLSRLALGAEASASSGARMSVFMHIDARARHVEAAFQKEYSGADIRALSRFLDLQDSLSGADAVLAPRPVLDALGLPPVLSGSRAGVDDEAYVLLSTRSLTKEDPNTVGVIDLLGRRGTRDFVERLLGRMPTSIRAVTKVEDLLPLLQLEIADAVLTPERWLESFRKESRLPLQAVRLSARVGLPALALVTPQGQPLVAQVKAMSPALCADLGVDAWH
jgi:hypothetical protein